jgi:integrase
MLFSSYFSQWVHTYKTNTVRPVTLRKYQSNLKIIKKMRPDWELEDVTRGDYQQLINEFAATHQHATCMDFHHQLRGSFQDAFDEGLIQRDPTSRISIGGVRAPKKDLVKYLEKDDAKKFIKDLNGDKELNWDTFLLLMINTGMRFAEGLALTPNDFDFKVPEIHITKSWDYKSKPGTKKDRFQPTKNKSSIRTISLDLKTAWVIKPLIEDLPGDVPIFPQLNAENGHRIFDSTVNDLIRRHCRHAGIPKLTGIHALRHTHASLLIASGVSIQAVAKRLGHANTSTTQNTYVHLLKSTEEEANEQITSILVNM